MLTFEIDEATGGIEFTVDGRVERAEFEAVAATLERLIAAHGRVHVVEVIRDYRGIDPALWWRDLDWTLGHLSDFGRCAVVTDSGWIGPFTRFAAAFMPMEIRVFATDRLDEARIWARGG